ncbi:MAG TPA: GNAT family N-acetyltransferase [Gaiellaceae bacterium]
MRIERVLAADEALVGALVRLLPQLSATAEPPGLLELTEVVAAPGTSLLVAREGDEVVGMLTLLLYRLPTGVRGWIHDVVVDEAARGRGIGEALTREALSFAEAAGARSVHLTTRPEREAANRLYRGLGFTPYETNVYVWRPH